MLRSQNRTLSHSDDANEHPALDLLRGLGAAVVDEDGELRDLLPTHRVTTSFTAASSRADDLQSHLHVCKYPLEREHLRLRDVFSMKS